MSTIFNENHGEFYSDVYSHYWGVCDEVNLCKNLTCGGAILCINTRNYDSQQLVIMNDTSTKPKNQMLPPFNSVFGFEVKVPSSAVPSKLNLNKRKLEHKVFVVPTEFAEKEYTVQDHYAPADSKPPTQQAHGRWLVKNVALK